MKFVIKDAKKIVEFIEIIKFTKCLTQYTTMMCDKDKMNIQLLDDTFICLLDVNFPCDWFDVYECEEPNVFSFQNIMLTKLFALYKKGTIMETTVDAEHYNLSYLNDKENKHFAIELIDMDRDLLSAQETETDLDFTIKTDLLESYLKDLSIHGETIDIMYKDDTLYFMGQGKTQIEIFESSLVELNVVDDHEFHGSFSIKYIKPFTKLKKVYKEVQFYLHENKPLLMKPDKKMNYFIAPKQMKSK